jgi:hypothetical protein
MSELPMIFSAESVRAILELRKTQTRRLLNPQPTAGWGFLGWGRDVDFYVKESDVNKAIFGTKDAHLIQIIKSRYNVGDIIWVKETWIAEYHPLAGARIRYKAGGEKDITGIAKNNPDITYTHKEGWNSPLFMPRWASRINLRVLDVRVEKVQDITEEDAIREGMWGANEPYQGVGDLPSDRYAHLWDRLSGKKFPWASNPWVTPIDFKRII